MAQRPNVRWRRPLAQHLQDWIAWYQVNQQKNQRNNQPDDRKSKGEARENLLHGSHQP
jgi:hypothetical protein